MSTTTQELQNQVERFRSTSADVHELAGRIRRIAAAVALANAAGDDFRGLPDDRCALVIDDFASACEAEGIDVIEYLRRIGHGNLPRYADTLR